MRIEKIQSLVDKICNGKFTSSDLGLFFIWLRPIVSDDEILLDLANFVAHNNERDRGVSYNYVHGFVINFLDVSEKGGTIHGLQPLFNKDLVISKLEATLKKNRVVFDIKKFESQKDLIIENLITLIEEADFFFKDKRVIRCYLLRRNNTMMFCLKADLKGPFIRMSSDASIVTNFFN